MFPLVMVAASDKKHEGDKQKPCKGHKSKTVVVCFYGSPLDQLIS